MTGYNLKSAFQRLTWRFTSGKFEPNQNDLDALKTIADWVNREKEERINQNRYFGKLVVYCLMREIEYFNDTNLAEKKLHEVLNFPLAYWFDRYRLQRIMRDFQETKEVLNIQEFSEIWDKHKDEKGYFNTEAIRAENLSNYTLISEHKDLLLQSLTRWEQKEINIVLTDFITELLNEYGNTP